MPFTSEAQRRYLWAAHPDVAQRFVDDGAKSRGLPARAKRKSKRSSKRAHPKRKARRR